jgi:hypothetical protein
MPTTDRFYLIDLSAIEQTTQHLNNNEWVRVTNIDMKCSSH